MKNENVCKFVTMTSDKQLITTNFVFESIPDRLNNISNLEQYTMRIVINGNGKMYVNNITHRLQIGTVFLTFPNMNVNFDVSEDFNCMYISFFGKRTQELFQRFRISKDNCVFEGHDGLVVYWQNCLGKGNDNNLDIISESVLLYTFAQISSCQDNRKQRLADEILGYVERHYSDPTISLTNMAIEMGYNSKYISRVFKENVGISFSEYLRNTRLQNAIFLMEHGLTTVKNIALLCGFTDPYYFSNVFKSVVGVYPSKYMGVLEDKKRSKSE